MIGIRWQRGTRWTGVLPDAAIDDAERGFGLRFGPDHRLLLRVLHSTTPRQRGFHYGSATELSEYSRPGFYDWVRDEPQIRTAMRRVTGGIDLDRAADGVGRNEAGNAIWPAGWGDRPTTFADRRAKVQALFDAAPKLIPICGHRHVVAGESSAVLSVVGTDIVIYGRDLRDYLLQELRDVVGDVPDPAAETWKMPPRFRSGTDSSALGDEALPPSARRVVGSGWESGGMGTGRAGGYVVAVSRDSDHRFSKPVESHIDLIAGLGVAGDAHAGVTVQHRSRVATDATQPNLRQVHLIHAELHDELRRRGYVVAPGRMGENVTTRGIALLDLPRGTQLHIGMAAVIEVTGLRNPCSQLNGLQPRLMKAVLDRDEEGRLIRKAGIMGIVICGGAIQPGDEIGVHLPPEPHAELRPV